MTHLGEWLGIRSSERGDHAHLEQLGELFASMCAEYIGNGDVITAEFGGRALTALGDERGVLLGIHDVDANPFMIRTLMARLDQTNAHAVAATSLRLDGPGTSARSAAPTVVAPQQPRQVGPFEVSRDFRSIDLDDILGEADSDSFADDVSGASCTWGEIAGFIERSIEVTSTLLGRTIAANYWREALARHDSLSPPMKVDPRGAVRLVEGHERSSCARTEYIEDAWQHFLARCARVLPTLEGLKTDTGAPPWGIVH